MSERENTQGMDTISKGDIAEMTIRRKYLKLGSAARFTVTRYTI